MYTIWAMCRQLDSLTERYAFPWFSSGHLYEYVKSAKRCIHDSLFGSRYIWRGVAVEIVVSDLWRKLKLSPAKLGVTGNDGSFGGLIMVRAMLAGTVGFASLGVAASVYAGDCKGCAKVVKTGEGFCCGHGKAFGVELTSKKLYKSLAGVELAADDIKCGGCKKAMKADGRCDHCNVAMAHGHAYHSPVAYALARGKVMSNTNAAHCAGCKTALASNGSCTACKVGFVAGRMFADGSLLDAAKDAYATLVKAAEVAGKCEACAVAMVTDGECSHCKVKFKDGKKTG